MWQSARFTLSPRFGPNTESRCSTNCHRPNHNRPQAPVCVPKMLRKGKSNPIMPNLGSSLLPGRRPTERFLAASLATQSSPLKPGNAAELPVASPLCVSNLLVAIGLPLRPMTVRLLPNTCLGLTGDCVAQARHVGRVGIMFGHPDKITPEVKAEQLGRGRLSWCI